MGFGISNLYSYNGVEIGNCVCDACIVLEILSGNFGHASYLELHS
jgi:hypothetical protein